MFIICLKFFLTKSWVGLKFPNTCQPAKMTYITCSRSTLVELCSNQMSTTTLKFVVGETTMTCSFQPRAKAIDLQHLQTEQLHSQKPVTGTPEVFPALTLQHLS